VSLQPPTVTVFVTVGQTARVAVSRLCHYSHSFVYNYVFIYSGFIKLFITAVSTTVDNKNGNIGNHFS
jgi:hypothetical protein